jgi:hypothetical protein
MPLPMSLRETALGPIQTGLRSVAMVTLLLASAALQPAVAQTDTSSLVGQVMDAAGGGVPHAQVRLRNQATGAERQTITGEYGQFLFAVLAPAGYEIQVQAKGFKSFRDTDIEVRVAQTEKIDVRLAVGDVAETVEVQGTVSPLNTESAATGTVIGQEKIQALPLNGRQFLNLALLVPGVGIGGESVQQNQVLLNSMGGFSASGGRTNNNEFLLDGVTNLDPDYNSVSYMPIADTLVEFQVQTSQLSAEYGRASGAHVNVVTKSGTNEWHGSAWEFLRNQLLDSRPFNLVSPDLPKFQRNQFGGTLGAPIRKNKLFVFGAFERLTLRQAAGAITTVAVPTALERQGDFSTPGEHTIYDATVTPRTPFPGNKIPISRLDPLALAAANFMPLANVPGTANQYVNSAEVLQQDIDNYTVRLDYVATSRLSLMGRYSISNEDDLVPGSVPGYDQENRVRPQNAMAGATMVLGPRAVNELRAGYNRASNFSGTPEPVFDVNGVQRNLPQFAVSGYAGMGGVGGGWSLTRDDTYQLYDNLTLQRGPHTIKLGAEILYAEYVPLSAPNTLGQFKFSTGQTARSSPSDGTGSLLASFLLGYPQNISRNLGTGRMDGRQPFTAAYVQDDWKVSPVLTLNLGLRYEISPPLYDVRSQTMGIDFSTAPSPEAIFASGRTGFYRPVFFICGQSGYPRACATTDKNNFAPRLGLAWQAAPKTVVRAGAGMYYSLTDDSSVSRLTNSLPASLTQTVPGDAFNLSFIGYENLFPTAVAIGPGTPVNLYSIMLDQRTSYAMQFSASIQREIGKDTVLEVGYVGTMGRKLQQNWQPSNAEPGAGAVGPRRPYAGAIYAPGMRLPSYVISQGDGVGGATFGILPNWADSNYDALTVRGERRFARGFSLLSSFAFSKTITNAPQFRNAGGVTGSENSPPQDSYNLRAERGLASFNNELRWVNTAVWDLPFGSGRRLLARVPAARILGNWQVAGIVTAQTGFPFTINLSGDTAGIGGGAGGILIRANPVPGQDAELLASQRSAQRWFNTGAFVAPPAYTLGTLGRNTLIGPGLFNTDVTLSRHWSIAERFRLDFRAEAFNLLNTPNYNQLGRILNSATFGQALNELSPRQLQFAAKVSF